MDKPRYEIRRIGVFSATKTLFLLGGFSGFLLGLVQWAFMGLIWSVTRDLPAGLDLQGRSALSDFMGDAMVNLAMFFPIFGGFMGAIGGAIMGFFLSWLYNLSVRFWGGLELEWETVQATVAVVPTSHAPGEQTPLPVMRVPSPPPTSEPEPPPGVQENRPPSSMYE